MPGHATAANKAYPQYDGGSFSKYRHFTFNPAVDSVYTFLSGILHEVNGMFPSGLIHLGGDEVAFGIQAWAGKPGIADMMTKYQLPDLEGLEHYFFKRMADTVTRMGDEVLCWDEAASTDLPAKNTIVFWWRQNEPAQLELALQKKYKIVLCPRLPLYFDFVQDSSHISGRRWNDEYFNTIDDIYNFPDRQMPSDEKESAYVLGIQANLWTETVGSTKRLDFMTFPRLAAVAESGWTNQAVKNEVSFNDRLKSELAQYDKAGIYYFNPFDPSAHPEAVDFMPVAPKPARVDRLHHKRHEEHHSRKSHGGKHSGKAHQTKPKKHHKPQ
jgi:hexosaminidase